MDTRKSFCRFCHVFCGIEVDIDTEQQHVLAVRGDPDNPYSKGYTCVNGRAAPEDYHHPERLLGCKKRVEDRWADIPSEEALDQIADKLLVLRERYGARSVAVYAGGGAGFATAGLPLTNAWLNAFGSPGLYTGYTLDCPSYTVAAHRFFGSATTPLGMYSFDVENAAVAMFIGTNPPLSHSPWLSGPYPAKKLRDVRARGMKLIVVDPRRTEMARAADLHLQVKPGEDASLLAGMLKIIIEKGLYDREYVDKYVSGLDKLRAAVQDFDLDYVSRRTRVPAEWVNAAAVMFASAPSGAVRQGTGITMSRHPNLNTQLMFTLNALCGRIDRKGGVVANPGAFEARAESAVPPPRPLFGDAVSRVRGLRALVSAPGLVEIPAATLAEDILTPGDDRIRALIVHGGNPATVFPDQEKTVRALKALELLVVIDPYVTATARFAHYVLAPRHFLERPDTTSFADMLLSAPFAQYTPAVLRRSGCDLIEEWEFGWGLAKRMGLVLGIPGISTEGKPTADEVLAALSAHARVSLGEVKKYPSGHFFGGLPLGQILPAIAHPDKKMAAAHPEVIAELREVRAEAMTDDGSYEPGEGYSHRLVNIRTGVFYNSKGHNLPSLLKKQPHNPAYMNPRDLDVLGVKDGGIVEIQSARGRIKAIAAGSADVMAGVIAMAHGWGLPSEYEGDFRTDGSPIQRLIPDDKWCDGVAGMPLMSALPVNVRALA